MYNNTNLSHEDKIFHKSLISIIPLIILLIILIEIYKNISFVRHTEYYYKKKEYIDIETGLYKRNK